MKNKITLIIIVLLMCISAQAQNNTTNSKRKIGVVLSGGGAKGFAHIGVLKVIDSLGIKVDYVAGTSMGAIIGGLYASGYSGKELDSIFKNIDFNELINDRLPRSTRDLYQRSNAEKYAITIPFDNFKISIPSALTRGQNTYNLLSKLTLHVSKVKDFKKLPIPFLCIATNVETGDAVVLEKGDLPEAIMASGALPTLFQPVFLDGDMLVDGGVINNYPVDELKARGINYIIGVDVQDDLLKRDDLKSAPDVLMQISNFSTIKAMEAKLNETDVYIKPDIKDFSMISFGEGAEIIHNGEKAALERIEQLKTLGKNKQHVYYKNQKYQDSITINSYTFEGNSNYSRSYLLQKLKAKNNTTIHYDDLEKGINNLIATNNFDTFKYKLSKSKNKEGYDFHGRLTESKNKMSLKLAAHYDNLYKSAALINLTRKQALFKNDEISFDMILGDNIRYNLDYFIDKGYYWSVGINSRYNTFGKNVNAQLYLNDLGLSSTEINKIDVDFADFTNQIYLQTLLKKSYALSIGAEHKYFKIKSSTLLSEGRENDLVFENTNYLSLFGNLKLDTYDNKYFPSKGIYFTGDFHTYLLASDFNKNFESFSIAKADMGYAFSVSNKLAFDVQAAAGFKLGSNSTSSLDFVLGGYGNNLINNFIPFIGYDFISLPGNSFIKGTLIADYEIFNKQHLTLEGNWANLDNDIFESGEWHTAPTYSGYGIGYALETFFGPIQAKYTFTPEQKENVLFFSIGFWF